ncbi:hypothetical protein GTP46_16285 [Duganella sp. FT135W]|uniref:Uncharacterized protein n=1 Tax=Duganella flavida TaxID=2692175 RepID=A0A6L8KA16_9BURK|nr:hypothetical protein [Duganella flavida]MYM24206.1 hypothetical protein [Duganella flavida]
MLEQETLAKKKVLPDYAFMENKYLNDARDQRGSRTWFDWSATSKRAMIAA